MKKLIAMILLLAVLAISLAACSMTDSRSTTTTATEAPAATQAATEAPAENTPEPAEGAGGADAATDPAA